MAITDLDIKTGIGATGDLIDSYFNGNDGNINCYSPVKPVRSNSYPTVDMAVCNYGFDLNQIAVSGERYVFERAKSLKGNGPNTYLRPRGYAYNEGYRGDDFVGYTPNAVIPYDYHHVEVSTSIGSYDIGIFKQSPSIDFSTLNACNNKVPAVIYRNGENSPAKIAHCTSYSNPLVFKAEFDSSGTYECVFVYTNTAGESGSECILMPDGYFTINVTGGGGDNPTDLSSVSVRFDLYPYLSGDKSIIQLNSNNMINYSSTLTKGTITNSSAELEFYVTVHYSGNEYTFNTSGSNCTISYPSMSQSDFNYGNGINLERWGPDFNDKKDYITRIDLRPNLTSNDSSVSWIVEGTDLGTIYV